MSRIIAEVTVERIDRDSGSRPQPFPEALTRYARAFLETGRDSLRFLWWHGGRWLTVHLIKQGGGPNARLHSATHVNKERVIMRVAEIELPRGVTVREIDVLTLLALGLTNIAIAGRLGTSARTVSTQIERLLTKLDQKTRGGLGALAVDSGLLRLPIPGGVDGSTGIGIVELETIVLQAPRSSQAPLRPAYPRKRPILVGAVIPTGVAAADGLEVLQGARLAVEELNAMGGVSGRGLELVTADADLFEWQSVQGALDRLFDQEVDAITTSYASAENGRMLDLVADYGRPFLHTATFEEQVQLVEADPSRYGAVFQTCPSETYYGAGLIRLLGDLEQRRLWRPRSRRIVSIEAETLSTRVTTARFLSTAGAAGWSLDELIRVPLGTRDWSGVVARLAKLDPEVVMVTHFLDQELAQFQQEYAKAGLPALVYCVYGPSIPRFQEIVGKAADGVIWSTTTGTYDDAFGRRFRSQYAARFGSMPGWSQAGAAYDQVHLLAAAWSATNSRRTADVAGYLRRRPHRGINGVYYFGESSQSTLSYPDVTPDASLGQAHMIYQIQDGAHRTLGPEPFGTASGFRMPTWCRPEQAVAS